MSVFTTTPVILGTSGVTGTTGVPGTIGATGTVGVTGMSFPFVSFPIQVDCHTRRKAKKWWKRSYDMTLTYIDGMETGYVVVWSFIDIFGFPLFSRTRKSADVLLTSVMVLDEQPA